MMHFATKAKPFCSNINTECCSFKKVERSIQLEIKCLKDRLQLLGWTCIHMQIKTHNTHHTHIRSYSHKLTDSLTHADARTHTHTHTRARVFSFSLSFSLSSLLLTHTYRCIHKVHMHTLPCTHSHIRAYS